MDSQMVSSGATANWFPFAARFAERRGANVACIMSALIIPLLHDALVSRGAVVERKLAGQGYATVVFPSRRNVTPARDSMPIGKILQSNSF